MTQKYAPRELQLKIDQLDNYDFRDKQGHPLKNCADFISLIKEIVMPNTPEHLDSLEPALHDRIAGLQEDFDEQIELIVATNTQIKQLAEMQIVTSAAFITFREITGTQIAALTEQVNALTIDLHTHLANAA